mgnify:CR=1 FL=1
MLCKSFRKLAHILHWQFITFVCTINATSYVAQLTIGKTDKAMRYNLHLCQLCKVHCQILQFGQMSKAVGLRFQYVSSPQSNNGETLSFVFATLVYIER